MQMIVGVVPLTAALMGFTTPGYAGMGYSYETFDRFYTMSSCVDRAQGAFRSGGWTDISRNDTAITAENGDYSGIIVCISTASIFGAQVVIVVMGEDANMAESARKRLKASM